ncbi:M15 family metallopeptidase [Nocardia puris]|uniref:D-alanyl-D-alanine carboxypeptidase-like protein n=1 Tax=Nocardia puris TaxID=208602 RepID=A0A366DD47_9NOCA|nr:M15 family metallopeptidase [Nocardia puris]RBO87956.1 D-alanyl-D-alanine carboxypeptidase-like protein [Nocardia puris]
MALITENGWRQCRRDECVNPVVPGTADVRPEVRAGDAATILIAWCAWWHAHVMRIDTYRPRDYWGWSPTNAIWNSNHLSGTAIDLNSTSLPWKRYAMPADLVTRVREGVRLFEGTVWWGGDWPEAYVDQMHTQLALPEGHPRLRTFAARLSEGYLGVFGSPAPSDDDDPVWDLVLHQLRGTV